MAPVFGAPAAAEVAQLIIVMAGDYRSKKEVAHILVPAMGRKVIDLGGNLEKGTCMRHLPRSARLTMHTTYDISANVQAHRELCHSWRS